MQAVAVATVAPESYGAVGLNYIKMGGNTTASYWSAGGTAAAGKWGNIASNGDITPAGSSSINGHARPGVGKTVYGAAGRVAGSTAPLKAPLSYPAKDSSPYGPTYNDNGRIPNDRSIYDAGSLSFHVAPGKSITLPEGVYYFSSFTVSGSITFTGPATVYAYNQVKLNGSIATYNNLPKNLKVYTVVHPTTGALPSGVEVSSNAAVRAFIYAPLSPATFAGTGDCYGSIVAKSIDMTGSSAIHYDLAIDANAGRVSLVQ